MMGTRRDIAAVVRDQVGPALTAGIDPASPQAEPIVAGLASGGHQTPRADPGRSRRHAQATGAVP
jgi:hypothetical protein